MKILLTYALESECGHIHLPNCEVLHCLTGVGKVSAALSVYEACTHFQPDLVLGIGTSGSIKHAVGSIVLCSTYVDRDLKRATFAELPYLVDFESIRNANAFNQTPNGKVSSGDTFLTSTAEADDDSDVYDMEAFGIASACQRLNIPFVSVKYVTDRIGENSIKHWEDKLEDAKNALEAFVNSLTIKL
jgi:adenosylhomocysteine nucleosidase